MESLLVALPALGCVVMMPLMMWLMGRAMSNRENGDKQPQAPGDQARAEELGQLRDEVVRLRAEIDTGPRSPESAGG